MTERKNNKHLHISAINIENKKLKKKIKKKYYVLLK